MQYANEMTPTELRALADKLEKENAEIGEITTVVTKPFRLLFPEDFNFGFTVDQFIREQNNGSMVLTLEQFDRLLAYLKVQFCEATPIFHEGEEITYHPDWGWTCHGDSGDFEEEFIDLNDFVETKV